MIKKIGILTSGGDCPGMNSAIRAISKMAKTNNVEVFLVKNGYKGLYEEKFIPADQIDLNEYLGKGGTIIGSSRFPEFKNPKIQKEVKLILDKNKIDAIVVIGGDGSYKGAERLHKLGLKVVVLPGTIDNDISSTDFTIGYDTALNTITNTIEKIRDTMSSHKRVAIVEVMGHGCDDLALFSGISVGSELIITNESPKTIDDIVEVIKDQMINKKKNSVIITISEFLFNNLESIRKEVQKKSGIVTKAITLSYIQRGGMPTASERIMATLMGIKSIKFLLKGKTGIALGIKDGKIISIPISESLNKKPKNRIKLTKIINKINQM